MHARCGSFTLPGLASGGTRKTADFLVGPGGGFAVFLLFAPTGGCAKPQYGTPCPNGEQENLFGTTLAGLVGTLDYAGADVLALIAGFLLYTSTS